MKSRLPQITIIGRTNVGKSTLFNALAGKRKAIIEDEPGVTRDRKYARVQRHGADFTLVDTGGVVGEESHFQSMVRHQAELAVQESQLLIALFDGKEGISPLDYEVVDLLRKCGKPVLWVVNKCERPSEMMSSSEFYALGLDEILCISAAHRGGVRELLEKIVEVLPQAAVHEEPGPTEEEMIAALESIDDGEEVTESEPVETEKDYGPIRVAVIGKPNVGKSTLINKILGEDRLITSSVAGTTRDSIDIHVVREGQEFTFIDTAGLRKKARIDDQTVERYANLRTLRSLASCDVAVLVLDATDGPPTIQDAKVGGLVHERGKGLVLVVNKWDLIEKDHTTVKQFQDGVYEVFKFAKYAPLIFVSALSGRRCPSVLETVNKVYHTTRSRMKTGELNRILKIAVDRRPPPVYHGQPVKFYFATQVDVAPPSIVLFFNHPNKLGYSYERYLRNAIRDHYPYEGVDIKMSFRKRRSNKDEE